MSISNFIAGLEQAKFDLTPREVAEIIWLWVKIPRQCQHHVSNHLIIWLWVQIPLQCQHYVSYHLVVGSDPLTEPT